MTRRAGERILSARTALGIELGSTRMKVCLVDADDPSVVLATGVHEWRNELVDGTWTYSLDAVWAGLRAAYADLVADAERRHGVRPTSYGALGISAMMHGYLSFDAAGELLTPFRTWRNTGSAAAAAELTAAFGTNIPLRWSIAHLHQAIIDAEPHVPQIDFLTTLAGYVHWRLSGRRVIGVGDASGMFPVAEDVPEYDPRLVARYQDRIADRAPGLSLGSILPEILVAGDDAGALTAEGAALLDPSGELEAGVPMCPPEGDAGTGMVATGAVAPRTGNVSAGTSVFAMVVLERPIVGVHAAIDIVTTPTGDPVAMVHCNNGGSELREWAGVFARFARITGAALDMDAVYEALFREALAAPPDAGGVLAYNHLSAEPVAELSEGRPLIVRTPESILDLGTVMRAQLHGVFATLALGMRVLAEQDVPLDRLFAHGGLFRTAGAAQRILAGALDVPVSVAETAPEGGAWGAAVLAAFLRHRRDRMDGTGGPGVADEPVRHTSLAAYLTDTVFRGASISTVQPDPADVAGFAVYLERYRAGLVIERIAGATLPAPGPRRASGDDSARLPAPTGDHDLS